jgi:hypothetical protein
MVERHRVDPTATYPGKASIIFYSSGPPEQQNGKTETREGPFMEAELNSPMVELAPGESYAMDTQWYPTRMGEDFKAPTYSGVIGKALAATATPAGLVLTGNFGVFYGRGGGGIARLMSVTPTEPIQLQTTVQAPPHTTRVSVHVVDANGLDRGPLGEVRVSPQGGESDVEK